MLAGYADGQAYQLESVVRTRIDRVGVDEQIRATRKDGRVDCLTARARPPTLRRIQKMPCRESSRGLDLSEINIYVEAKKFEQVQRVCRLRHQCGCCRSQTERPLTIKLLHAEGDDCETSGLLIATFLSKTD